MNDLKTTTIGKLTERLSELPANAAVLQWGLLADNRFRRPKRKKIDTVESLIAWLRRFPKNTEVELFFIRTEDRLKYTILVEFGLKETLQDENHE